MSTLYFCVAGAHTRQRRRTAIMRSRKAAYSSSSVSAPPLNRPYQKGGGLQRRIRSGFDTRCWRLAGRGGGGRCTKCVKRLLQPFSGPCFSLVYFSLVGCFSLVWFSVVGCTKCVKRLLQFSGPGISGGISNVSDMVSWRKNLLLQDLGVCLKTDDDCSCSPVA